MDKELLKKTIQEAWCEGNKLGGLSDTFGDFLDRAADKLLALPEFKKLAMWDELVEALEYIISSEVTDYWVDREYLKEKEFKDYEFILKVEDLLAKAKELK